MSCSDLPKHGNKMAGLSLAVEMGMKKLSQQDSGVLTGRGCTTPHSSKPSSSKGEIGGRLARAGHL